MKHVKKLIVLALASVLAHAAVDDCAQTDHLFYDSACCAEEGNNCLDSIQKTSKAAINNLLNLKRADLSECQDTDTLVYKDDKGDGSSGVLCSGVTPPQNNTRL